MLERLPEFLGNHPLLTGALIAVVALILYTEFQRATRKYRALPPSEAVRVMNREGALVLDVREDNELTGGRIAASRHIPMGVLKKRITDIERYKESPVVVYCRSGARSAVAASQLVSAGFTDVTNLQGGIQAWQSAGLPVKKK
ncbi:rhodanese-like domain-containing protein [Thioalkalivibrio paradoxus]|uniref:Sulfurtransferase n=1 Tax=Thioalkalivibrio paradoxus ARh 1 TaxID=713585 RepID=W0DR64_9GAMM|nr:rhodanese-like domain-containing protein [Thioalkalivibrio paradoxus]AHE99722.1 sulfurtransferase [Thioalkalivibrio paradoxus ARh 1]